MDFSNTSSIVCFRQDLRISDQPALNAAIKKGGPIVPVFIWDPKEYPNWTPGAASKWWLHHSLSSLEKDLQTLGLQLVIRQGSTIDNLLEIAAESNADTIFWNRRYEPVNSLNDANIQAFLQTKGLAVCPLNGSLLFEPWEILNKQSKPFQVFTHFWNCCLKTSQPKNPQTSFGSPLPLFKKIRTETIHALDLLPHIHWDAGFKECWEPGSQGALKKLQQGLKCIIPNYVPNRDHPDIEGTSRLSPHLHFGEISPNTIWEAVKNAGIDQVQSEAYLRQLGWREFAYYLLYHFPYTTENPLQKKFEAMPWSENTIASDAWKKGLTGYPIVDAGMRQLWKTGWMHNRVRMITGSFLVKDLLVHWLEGAKWFWDTLVDADLANNTLGWQWIGGCGADAAPYFRIFNPVLQGKKFDPFGTYVKKWVPELRNLPDKWIHTPWEAPPRVLNDAALVLGKTYPLPIVNHDTARIRALQAFSSIKEVVA